VPEGVTDVDALGMILSAVTPYQMLTRVAKMQAGQSLLIHGAGGAVGTAMLQLARDAGIAAFGTDMCRQTRPDPQPRRDATRRRHVRPKRRCWKRRAGCRCRVRSVGRRQSARSLHALKPGGMLVAFGFQNEVLGRGGSIPMDFVKLKLWDWLPNGHATAFYSIGAMRRKHPEWFRDDLATLFEMLAAGRIAPVVAEVLPLAEVQHAHERVEAGEVAGKLVLRVTEQ
jgi:NADPH:quinone reductase-like Zn-dependent oxidoreductase